MKSILTMMLFASFAANAQTPMPPAQKAALEKYAELQKRKPADTKECDALKVMVPLKHPASVLEEQAAEFNKCMTARGHYVP